MGGMVSNNSFGLHSIVWAAIRNNLLEAIAILSDGSEAVFKEEDISDNRHTGFKKKI